jgi:uncharacterized protein (DUF1501 family)
MLSFSDGRRAFLRAGALSLGGLALPQLLAAKSAAARDGRPVRDKSVIFLFMHGGPPQTETFDPKGDAPSEIRSAVGEIPTALPGVHFGSTFEGLAKRAKRIAVVRSFATGNGDHDLKPLMCADTLKANLGSVYARVAGVNHPETGMPRNVALYPDSVDPSTRSTTQSFGRFDATGLLGAAYAPFVPGAGGNAQKDMTLTIPKDRLDDRRTLLERLDALRRDVDRAGGPGGPDRFREQAYDVLMGGVAKAFDLSKEDPRVVARYDTSGLIRHELISQKWNNHKNYLDHVKSLGKQLLLARRLCEAGAGFVTVTTNFVWDFHADQNNATIEEGLRYVGAPFDHAVSAFLDDVEARGLSEKILLVACGEIGRTPKINAKGGRDHWGKLAPLLLAGGGLRMGQVIGESTKDAGEPDRDLVTIPNLLATVLHALLDPAEVRLMPGLPAEILRLATETDPIRELTF